MFDEIYESNQFHINILDNNLNLQFESLCQIKFEIKLFRENMTIDDKLNMIYNEIASKNNNNKLIKENVIKLEYLNNNKNNRDVYREEARKKEMNLNQIKTEDGINNYEIKEILDIQKKCLDNLKEEFYEFKKNIERKINKYFNNISIELEKFLKENETVNVFPNKIVEEKIVLRLSIKLMINVLIKLKYLENNLLIIT